MLKKLIVLATVVGLGTFALSAAAEGGSESSPAGRPEGRPSPEERLSRMQKHLDLSDDQVSQIREIHKNGGGREDVATVLNDDQLSQVRNHRKNQHRHRGRAEGGKGQQASADN